MRLENNFGEGVLNLLEFILDIVRCTEESRVGVVKTITDTSMSNE